MSLSGNDLQSIILAITVIGGSVLYYRARKPTQDTTKRIETLEGLVRDYEKKFKVLEDKSAEDTRRLTDNDKAIYGLQEQIKVYKELPLRELADGMREVVSGNKAILNVLQKSATTLVKDTHNASEAVKEVRQDLRSN